MNNYTILCKFPTRSRPQKFFAVLDQYYSFATNIDLIRFVITCDFDDPTMNNDAVIAKLKTYKNLEYYFGNSKTKIEAVNADINDLNWDVLLLASDDMIPIVKGYDQIIRNEMAEEYPDTDGVLWFYDGHRDDLNTLCILGRQYYRRFNYIYYPGYITWWADNEFMLVSRLLGKETAYDTCIIEHRHPVWVKGKRDELFKKENDSRITDKDKQLFHERELNNFGIYKYKLSLLICTLEKRKHFFERIKGILEAQLVPEVQVLFAKDNGEKSIGEKRNMLLDSAAGEYLAFIDDDDRVSPDYIQEVLKGCNKGVDCVSLLGNITINGKNPKLFIHSLDYKVYSEAGRTYYRPPNHLNAIKSSIAKQFRFPELNRNEDTNWAMQIADAGVLKTEHKVEKVIYYYDYIPKKK